MNKIYPLILTVFLTFFIFVSTAYAACTGTLSLSSSSKWGTCSGTHAIVMISSASSNDCANKVWKVTNEAGTTMDDCTGTLEGSWSGTLGYICDWQSLATATYYLKIDNVNQDSKTFDPYDAGCGAYLVCQGKADNQSCSLTGGPSGICCNRQCTPFSSSLCQNVDDCGGTRCYVYNGKYQCLCSYDDSNCYAGTVCKINVCKDPGKCTSSCTSTNAPVGTPCTYSIRSGIYVNSYSGLCAADGVCRIPACSSPYDCYDSSTYGTSGFSCDATKCTMNYGCTEIRCENAGTLNAKCVFTPLSSGTCQGMFNYCGGKYWETSKSGYCCQGNCIFGGSCIHRIIGDGYPLDPVYGFCGVDSTVSPGTGDPCKNYAVAMNYDTCTGSCQLTNKADATYCGTSILTGYPYNNCYSNPSVCPSGYGCACDFTYGCHCKSYNYCCAGSCSTGACRTCYMSASPTQLLEDQSSTITLNYNNLASTPGNVNINCGNGKTVTATCSGTTGSCSAVCTYPTAGTYTVSATTSGVNCVDQSTGGSVSVIVKSCSGSVSLSLKNPSSIYSNDNGDTVKLISKRDSGVTWSTDTATGNPAPSLKSTVSKAVETRYEIDVGTLGDFVAEFDAYPKDNRRPIMHFFFRVNSDWSNGYYFRIDSESCAGCSGFYTISPWNKISGSTSFTNKNNEWASFKIEVMGSSFKAYKNGVLVASATDSTFSSGKIGIGEHSQGAGSNWWDNLRIITYISEPTSVLKDSEIIPSTSGTSYCDGKTVYFKKDSCTGTQVSSCTIPSGSGNCTGTKFTAPSSMGTYTYYACIDKNKDGDFADAGESSSKPLTVIECTSNNQCTTPANTCYQTQGVCSAGKCSYTLKCDGSTCPIATKGQTGTDYCNYCSHCGDNVCNCGESFGTCDDCPYGTFSYSILPEWNLISIPANNIASINSDPCGIFSGDFYYYNAVGKRYEALSWEKLTGGKGYWIYSPKKETCTVNADISKVITVSSIPPLQSGHNLIGTASVTQDVNSVKGSCTIKDGPYYWDATNQKWISSNKIETGKGYWLNVSSNCNFS